MPGPWRTFGEGGEKGNGMRVRQVAIVCLLTGMVIGLGGCNGQSEIPLAKVPPPPPGFGELPKAAPGTVAGSPANAIDLVK